MNIDFVYKWKRNSKERWRERERERDREVKSISRTRKYRIKTNGIEEIKDMKSESYVITQHLSYAFCADFFVRNFY